MGVYPKAGDKWTDRPATTNRDNLGIVFTVQAQTTDFADGASSYLKVGKYDVTLTVENPNYDITITNDAGEEAAEKAYEVTARAITLKPEATTSVYGEKFEFKNTFYTATVINGSGDAFILDDQDTINEYITIKLKESDKQGLLSEGKLPVTKDGGYTIVIEYSGTGAEEILKNYAISTEPNTDGHVVTPRPITVTIVNKSFEYGTELSAIQGQLEWLPGGDTDEIQHADKKDGKLNISLAIFGQKFNKEGSGVLNAGEYAVIGTYTGDNYTVTFAGKWQTGENALKAGVLEITRRKITIQVTPACSVYGEEIKNDGKWEWKAYYGHGDDVIKEENDEGHGLVWAKGDSHDSVLFTFDKLPSGNAGSYVMSGKFNNDNYDIKYENNSLYTIYPRKITVTLKKQSNIYGQYDAAAGYCLLSTAETTAFTAELSGVYDNGAEASGRAILENDNINLVLSLIYNESLDKDGGDISTGGVLKVKNYGVNVSYTNANYDITFKYEGDPELNKTLKPYEESEQPNVNIITVNLFDIVQRELQVRVKTTQSSVYGEPVEKLSSKNGTDWDITGVVGLDIPNSNYILDGEKSTVENLITLTLDNKDAAKPTDYDKQLADGRLPYLLKGYIIYGYAGENPNYKISINIDNLYYRIIQRSIQITIQNQSGEYNGTETAFNKGGAYDNGKWWKATAFGGTVQTVTGNFIVNGDEDKMKITLSKAAGVDEGTYLITGVCGNENYQVTFVQGVYTVTPRVIELEITEDGRKALTSAYDGTEPEILQKSGATGYYDGYYTLSRTDGEAAVVSQGTVKDNPERALRTALRKKFTP